MSRRRLIYIGIIVLGLVQVACIPKLVQKTENKNVPESFNTSTDTINSANISWKDYFQDPNLVALIDTALRNNQELNIVMQEILMSQNEIQARKGEYLPFVNIGAGAGVDKVGRYTSQGANDANTEIMDGKEFPEPLGDFMISANAFWEIDVWRKLRNAKKAATMRYLASIEGKNFLVTQLVAEIANAYYELMALDNQLEIVQNNIEIQQNALKIIKMQKASAKVTELAVKKFEAEVLKTTSLQFGIEQNIVQTENEINVLLGRFPQPIIRNSKSFIDLVPDTIYSGIPSQLLENRPDIQQAELELAANKIDVAVAKAEFYPSIAITGGVGFNAFNPKYLVTTPQSLIFSLAGDLMAPMINRNAIKANYYNANAQQVQAVYNYQLSIIRAFVEVANHMAMIENSQQSFDIRKQQVQVLTESIEISSNLFKSARADYMEVLMTQRDALESKIELVETKKMQMHAMVNLYKALGGGWR